MPKKTYKLTEEKPMTVEESAIAYRATITETQFFDKWNPNLPFHGTQEEWWEHFQRIEQGTFTPLREANKEFGAWKQKYLANKLN